MLTHLVLENFKAFGGRRIIPTAPITLIFGENSAGKTSILQSLLLLKQTALRQEVDDALLVPKGALVDLGSLENAMFAHDPERVCEIAPIFRLPVRERDPFHQSSPDPGVLPASFDSTSELSMTAWRAAMNPNPAVGMGIRARLGAGNTAELSELRFYFEDPTTAAFSLRASKDVLNTQPPSYGKRLPMATSYVDGDGTLQLGPTIQWKWDPVSRNAHYVDIADVDEHAFLWRQFAAHVSETLEYELSGGQVKFPRISTPELTKIVHNLFRDQKLLLRNLKVSRAHDYEPPDLSLDPWADDMTGPVFPNIAEMAMEISSELLLTLERIRYLGPYRTAPDRYTVFGGNIATDVGVSGASMPDVLFRQPELVDKINGVLETKFKLDYRLRVNQFYDRVAKLTDVFSLELMGKQNKRPMTPVNLRDVGFGVSQVLPILVQSLLAEEAILLIEQPELHLHPRLQAELGDVFIESALRVKNMLLVETHSEHLILRLMRRLRDTGRGTLPPDLPPVHPDDVSILYVQPTEHGSIVRALELDNEGHLLDPWPGGFFEDGFRERFS